MIYLCLLVWHFHGSANFFLLAFLFDIKCTQVEKWERSWVETLFVFFLYKMIYSGFVFWAVFCFLSCLEVPEQVFGLLWLPPEGKMLEGPLSVCCDLLCQGNVKECIAEVPPLAAQGRVIFWIHTGPGTAFAAVFSCAVRSLFSPDLLLMSSPWWGDYEFCSAAGQMQFYESTLFSMWTTC